MLRNFVKKQDYFTTPDVEKRVYGGIIGLSSYVFVVAYLVYYIINAAMSEYPLSTAVLAFPDTAVDAYTMPPMKCVATNGVSFMLLVSCFIWGSALAKHITIMLISFSLL